MVITEASRFNVAACGRRWGKDTLGIDRLINGGVLAAPLGWFSPTYKSLLEVWRVLKDTLRPITKRSSIQERRIELITGGTLDLWSLDNPDIARGRMYRRIIINEAAFVPHMLDIWSNVLRPTLTDLIGDAWFFSTPKGFNGFKTLFDWGMDPQLSEWVSWQLPTSKNPFISPDEIESMRRGMPERVFRQEILAEFLDDAGGVFRRVMDAATSVEAEPVLDHQYIFGVGWAKSADFTVFTVLDSAVNSMVYMDRFNQIDYTVQVSRLKALAEKYRPTVIIAERNSIGEPIIEQLQRDGLPVQPFTTTNASKAQAIDALSLAFERGEIRILPDPMLISELQAYETERLPSGMLRYSAPEGIHDDTVMSLALAWSGIANRNWIFA